MDIDFNRIVDTERYPIHPLSSIAAKGLVERCRESMRTRGLCLLPAFVRTQALAVMRDEAQAASSRAFFCHNTHNAYLRNDDPRLPESHPARRRLHTQVGSIAYDLLPPEGLLTRLYQWDPLTAFIGAVQEHKQSYRSADRLGALSINVFEPQGSHAWHFDEATFTTTLMLQPGDEGGYFEYVPNLRTESDDNYDGVRKVLDGDEEGVLRAPFEPGTLFVFQGRYSLHRVTPLAGQQPRLVAVLCYEPKPGVTNSDEVRLLFWGRTGREVAQ
jgi:hypothetical protein